MNVIDNDVVMSVLGVLKGFYKEERSSVGFAVERVPVEREAYMSKLREGKSFVRCEMELDKEFEFKREEIYYGEVKEQSIKEMFDNIICIEDIETSSNSKFINKDLGEFKELEDMELELEFK